MSTRSIAVSTVVFDGYPIDTAFSEIAKLGIGVVEPAFIRGYMTFDESDFEDAAQAVMRQKLSDHGLSAVAISAHMDSGHAEAEAMLARRIRFAAAIGARYMITNSTTVERESHLRKVIDASLRLAERCGIIMALENPGLGATDLMHDAEAGAALVQSFNSPWLRFNYDTANSLTCSEGTIDPVADIHHALPLATHVHLKDCVHLPDRWQFTAIGQGEINSERLLQILSAHPQMPLTIELPLSLLRYVGREPARNPQPLPLSDITRAISQSWAFVTSGLAAAPTAQK